MKPVEPILTTELFPELSRELVVLLRDLSSVDWGRSTACPCWTVKDIAAHLLGGNIGRITSNYHNLVQASSQLKPIDKLSELMNQISQPDSRVTKFNSLVKLINQRNAEWVEIMKQISQTQLIEHLELTDKLLYELFKSRSAHEQAPVAVAWAGDTQSPNWFDIAREYTEKWHHQQHIRDAINQPGLKECRWFYPVLDTLMRALPHTYRNQTAPEGTVISFTIVGDAGGDWSLLRQANTWKLFTGKPHTAASSVYLAQDLAWRLFTNGMSQNEAKSQVQIEGEWALGAEILNMVSIMA